MENQQNEKDVIQKEYSSQPINISNNNFDLNKNRINSEQVIDTYNSLNNQNLNDNNNLNIESIPNNDKIISDKCDYFSIKNNNEQNKLNLNNNYSEISQENQNLKRQILELMAENQNLQNQIDSQENEIFPNQLYDDNNNQLNYNNNQLIDSNFYPNDKIEQVMKIENDKDFNNMNIKSKICRAIN